MNFFKVAAGHYRAYSPAHDVADIRRHGPVWRLEIRECDTGGVLHAYSAVRQYLCAQEANRFYRHGAYGSNDP